MKKKGSGDDVLRSMIEDVVMVADRGSELPEGRGRGSVALRGQWGPGSTAVDAAVESL
jgi:hypothetical protein